MGCKSFTCLEDLVRHLKDKLNLDATGIQVGKTKVFLKAQLACSDFTWNGGKNGGNCRGKVYKQPGAHVGPAFKWF